MDRRLDSQSNMRALDGREPIAVIGLACRFPGAPNAEAFWQLLIEGRDAVGPMPPDRFDARVFDDSEPGAPGMIATRRGGFLADVDLFDAGFFGISPREAHLIDPQHRLLLETTLEALEDAGVTDRRLAASRCGVFAGVWTNDYERLVAPTGADVDVFAATGTGRYAAAGRISYGFDLHGPSLAVDTACSSSLVAVHLACQSLRTHECDIAIVGAVNLILDSFISVAYSRSGLLSIGGSCLFGDARADGYVRSEGVGVLILKRTSTAVQDGDRIRASIAGSAVNNDGRGSGSLMAPSSEGQAAMLRAAYGGAGVNPRLVQYVEAHGTGTRVGDPVEIRAIAEVVGAGRPSGDFCLVGSVKTNIGHTESAAGMAGLIKVILAFERGLIPPTRRVSSLNSEIDWEGIPVKLCTEATTWRAEEGPPIAGVSGFGITGTNAHIVVQQAPPSSIVSAEAPPSPALIPLSAKATAALRELASQWRDCSWDDSSFRDVAYTAAVRRTHFPKRLTVMADGFEELGSELTRRLTEGLPERSSLTPPSVVFVFPGQGSQWAGMGRQLLVSDPVARETLQECDAAVGGFSGFSVIDAIGRADARDFEDIGVVQPLLFALQVALARLWMSWGIRPAACIGHSMGEVAAAHLAGILTLDDAARVICTRSALLRRKRGKGAMALVDAPVEATTRLIAPFSDRLSIAVINSMSSTVVAGEPLAVEELLASLEKQEIFCRPVKVDVASHSSQMDDLLDPLVAAIDLLRPLGGDFAIYSTVSGDALNGSEFGADYWVRNLRQPVQFASACRAALRDGHGAFVEISGHPLLVPSILDTAGRMGITLPVVSSLRRETDERRAMLGSLGELYEAGCDVEWRALNSQTRAVVSLPSYPWQRERFWVDQRNDRRLVSLSSSPSQPAPASVQPDVSRDRSGARKSNVFELLWEEAPPNGAPTKLASRWLVLTDDSVATEVLSAAAQRRGVVVECAPLQGEGAGDMFQRALNNTPDCVVVVTPRWRIQLDAAWRDVERLLMQASEKVLEIVKAIASRLKPPRLWVITDRAQSLEAAAEATDPVGTALWGLLRVVWEEYPEIAGGSVDVIDLDADVAKNVVEALLARTTPRQSAIRAGRLLVPRLIRSLAPSNGVLTLRPDAAYLITGGLGGVGLVIARRLVERGARNLILAGRNGLPPKERWSQIDPESDLGRRVKEVETLEGTGATVRVVALDVGDEESVKSCLTALDAEGPCIRGVVHAATIVHDSLIEQVSADEFIDVIRAKAGGAWHLQRYFGEANLDFMMCCSSVAALFAQPGQASYAAANAFLDGLMQRRFAMGTPATSIRWGGWRNVGLAASSKGARQAISDLERDGIDAFDAEQGLDAFERVVAGGVSQALVFSPDQARLVRGRRVEVEPDLFRNLVPSKPVETPTSSGDLRRRLLDSASANRRRLLELELQTELAGILRLPSDRVPFDTPVGALGLESLMALEFLRRIEKALNERLAKTLVWRYPTIAALADYLIARLFPEAVVVDASSVPSTVLTNAAISEDQALAALLGTKEGR